jgi:hypothetical protein
MYGENFLSCHSSLKGAEVASRSDLPSLTMCTWLALTHIQLHHSMVTSGFAWELRQLKRWRVWQSVCRAAPFRDHPMPVMSWGSSSSLVVYGDFMLSQLWSMRGPSLESCWDGLTHSCLSWESTLDSPLPNFFWRRVRSQSPLPIVLENRFNTFIYCDMRSWFNNSCHWSLSPSRNLYPFRKTTLSWLLIDNKVDFEI